MAYSGHNSKGSVEKKCVQQDFLDFLKKQLPKTCPSEEYATMYDEIVLGTFMPKIVSKDNSVIPMQINKAELVTILKNVSGYLPFLNEKDEPQYSVLSLLAGATVKSANLFDDEELKDSEAASITFSGGYDDKVSLYESVFGENFELIERLKAVYDWAVLADILNDKKYLS